jgi:peroxidase
METSYLDPSALLPNPRKVSNDFHFDSLNADYTTHMLTQFGQFLDHDITLTPESEVGSCCTFNKGDKKCFPIEAPCNDGFDAIGAPCSRGSIYGGGRGGFISNTQSCLHFGRSVEFCHEVCNGARDQMNGITAFIDGSNIYGSSEVVKETLRSGDFLKVANNRLLPVINGGETAGDTRAREMPGLAAMHTIFLREHNRIVQLLSRCKSGNLYEEVRRIVGAELQNIVYNEYLPIVLGSDTMQDYNLTLNLSGDEYDPDIDPSIRNSFSLKGDIFREPIIYS